MISKIAVLVALFGLAACDAKLAANHAEQAEQGQWLMTAVTTPTVIGVWRMNTKTGQLQFCYNSSGIQCDPAIDAPAPSLTDEQILNALTGKK